MARYLVENELSPLNTNIVAESESQVRNVESAQFGAALIFVSAVPGGGQELDVIVQGSLDNTNWFDMAAINSPITAIGNYAIRLAGDAMLKVARLKYKPSGAGPFILRSVLATKEEARYR